MTAPAAAVILAGGRGRRLGGVDKPALRIGQHSLLDIAIDAVRGGPISPIIVVVGPARELPDGILQTREAPPGGGPAAAVAAGVLALAAAGSTAPDTPGLQPQALVAVLAADLPGIDRAAVTRLSAILIEGRPGVRPGGAVLVDPGGKRQYLIGVWRYSALAAAVGRHPDWAGVALRELLDPIPVVELAGSARETADVDTPADWQQWQS